MTKPSMDDIIGSTTSVKMIEVQSIVDKSAEKTEEKIIEEVTNVEDKVENILSLEKILVKELQNISASRVTWQTSPDKKFKLCIFFVSSSEAENVLNTLGNAGIGHDFDSSIRCRNNVKYLIILETI